MNYLKLLPTLILVLLVQMSCEKKEDDEIVPSYDCVFVQNDDDMDGFIDDTERMTMNECKANSLLSKSAIESNLIGEWELIGHGEGGIPRISQPCGYIIITEDELTFEFKYGSTDTITTHQWEIEVVNTDEDNYFRLNVDSGYVFGLFINQFCEKYMYGDETPLDGNMHLYTKVE